MGIGDQRTARAGVLAGIAVIVACLVAGLVNTPSAAVGSGPVSVTHRSDITTGVPHWPTDVAKDKWGYTYIVSQAENRVARYGPDGVYIDSFGTTGTADGEFSSPIGVETDRYGNVYVAESGGVGRVQVFNQWASHVRTIDGTGSTDMGNALRVGVALDGDVYALDSGQRVLRFDDDGTYAGSRTTTDPTTGLAVDQDRTVYTCIGDDFLLPGPSPLPYNSVVAFTGDGVELRSWGGEGSALGQLWDPWDVGVDGAGNVFVAEENNGRGQVFAPDGTPLTTFGSGLLDAPQGVGVGFDRTVLATDRLNDRIRTFEVTVSTEVTQVAGANRYATARAASQKAFPDRAAAVVVASAANWPDALAGAPLCGVLGAPLLLTEPSSLPQEVVDEIVRLAPAQAYVLGGTRAVSESVFSTLESYVGVGNVHRIAGASRYDTAAMIASETASVAGTSTGTGVLVTGRNWPDALAVAPIAAANGWPVLLTEPDTLSDAAWDAIQRLEIRDGHIVGGQRAISVDVQDFLNNNGVNLERTAGGTRYETSAKVAESIGFERGGMLWSRPALATGQNYVDALAGGVLQGSDCSVMLLTPKDSLDPHAAAALTARRDMIYEMRFLGGTNAVSQPVRDAVTGLLH